MVGYVLLVVIAITLSVLVYGWMKDRILKQTATCPDSVSIMIEEYVCDNTDNTISLKIKNNGLFNIRGIFAKATNSERVSELTRAIERKDANGDTIIESDGDTEISIGGINGVSPGRGEVLKLYYNEDVNDIVKISIQPFIQEDGKILVCDNSIISQDVDCDSTT